MLKLWQIEESKVRKILTSLVCLLALSGCASIPKNLPQYEMKLTAFTEESGPKTVVLGEALAVLECREVASSWKIPAVTSNGKLGPNFEEHVLLPAGTNSSGERIFYGDPAKGFFMSLGTKMPITTNGNFFNTFCERYQKLTVGCGARSAMFEKMFKTAPPTRASVSKHLYPNKLKEIHFVGLEDEKLRLNFREYELDINDPKVPSPGYMLSFDLSESSEFSLQEARFEVIRAEAQSITYRVLQPFSKTCY